LFILVPPKYGLSIIFNIDTKNYAVIGVKWVENDKFIRLKEKF